MSVLVGDVVALDGGNQAGPGDGDYGGDGDLTLLRLADGRFVATWLQNAPDGEQTTDDGNQTFSAMGKRPFYSVFNETGTVTQVETLIDFAHWRAGGNVNPQFSDFGLQAAADGFGGFTTTWYDNTRFPNSGHTTSWFASVDADGQQLASNTTPIRAAFYYAVGTSGSGGVASAGDPVSTGLIVNGVDEGIDTRGKPSVTRFVEGFALSFTFDSDPTSAEDLDVFVSFRPTGAATSAIRVSESSAGRQEQGNRGEWTATLADGSVLVIWHSFLADVHDRLSGRIFGPDGQPRTAELTLVEPRPGEPTVVALDTGGFALAYTDSSGFLQVQAFGSDGVAATTPFTLPTLNFESLFDHDLVDLGGGRVMVGWIQQGEPRGVVVDLQLPNVLRGTPGVDTLNGTTANEQLFGQEAADVLNGGLGNDELYGGLGNDALDGGAGDDKMFGGAGNDGLRGSGGADAYDGGDGVDVVNFDKSNGVNVFLDGSGTNGASAVGDTFVNIENLIGSLTGPDFLVGNSGANRLTGNGGNDRLYGRGGVDQLEGGAGMDQLLGGAGADAMVGGADADRFIFDTRPLLASERDRIGDFLPGTDKLQIDASAFGGGLVAGGAVTLIANASPNSAGQVGGVFLYDTDTGFLSWDRDGGGAESAVLFVWLQGAPAPSLTAGDFLVVA